jgi:hypothetical protein
VRFAIGVVVGASCLLGCSGGVLDVGSSDAGDPREVLPLASPAVTGFSAAAVQKAHELCGLTDGGLPSIVYPPSVLRSELTGGWLLCHWIGPMPEDARSVQFTEDGHWYTLGNNGDGGLARVSLGSEAGPVGSEGTYTFLDTFARPLAPDASADFVAVNGLLWFHPEFQMNGAGFLMTMHFIADGYQSTCVRIDP